MHTALWRVSFYSLIAVALVQLAAPQATAADALGSFHLHAAFEDKAFDDQRWIGQERAASDDLGLGSSQRSSPLGCASRSSSTYRRHLLQPIAPNSVNVRPGMLTSSSTTQWATVMLDPQSVGSAIPKSFLGISHEWTNVEELNHGGSYLQLLQDLTAYGSGPLILRVGGGSTDLLAGIPPASTWKALEELHDSTGVRFIFGLNFYKLNVSLAIEQMDAILAHLPRSAIVAFEVGNEPNFYENIGGRNGDAFVRCCYINTWNYFARMLSCRNGSASCIDNQLAGPAWGHINMLPNTLDWFLRPNWRWMSLMTVHWYKAARESGDTVSTLLDEYPLRTGMDNLKQLVEVSKRWGKELRVAEMNTISNSGRQGISNSLAAALWTLDGAFEVAATGATGINLHWGDGLALYAALLRQGSGNSIVKPPYYAYLMFQMALGSGAAFISTPSFQATPGSKIKVWALKDTSSGAVRIVLINKDGTGGAGIVLRFPTSAGFKDGKLLRLVGQKGLEDQWSVSLGGMTYTLGGKPFGVPEGEVVTQSVSPQQGMEGYPVSYTVSMPPGSAALLMLSQN